ncbi:DUF4386 domain-containing protein [Flavihumibacter sp. ZG627]|uniref:DUF4386 domain-containing protein n=1 Tax=Flavihumibacter sp. ZG627 TaxID=1463156 RepID=UPI00057F11A3|nr:DUF4386 domain-containing protein [Flavihumibacter sp. ZG627]KIC89845.1 hypothetical protein HY58_14325 [Flavihumibacter sp. ZG627]
MDSKVKIARIAGFLYLLIIIFGLIAQIFVRDNLVDYDNATTTAKNILASEFWYRFGFVSELLMLVCDIGVTTILYILLKDTSRNLSLLSTLFRLSSIIILSVAALTHYAALSFLKGSNYLDVFTSSQLNAFALLSIRLHGTGYNISLLFFGFHLIILGFLIYQSRLFKKFLGILLLIGGICYIANSFIWFLFPDLVKLIYPAIIIPCAIGEWIFCFWLLIKGVAVPKIKTLN